MNVVCYSTRDQHAAFVIFDDAAHVRVKTRFDLGSDQGLAVLCRENNVDEDLNEGLRHPRMITRMFVAVGDTGVSAFLVLGLRLRLHPRLYRFVAVGDDRSPSSLLHQLRQDLLLRLRQRHKLHAKAYLKHVIGDLTVELDLHSIAERDKQFDGVAVLDVAV